jgi:imidazolonepropionase-like amidohydrolase
LRAIKFRIPTILAVSILLAAGAASIGRARAAHEPAKSAPPAPLENKFKLHKFEQPIGEETYSRSELAGNGGSQLISYSIEFQFTDRGTAVPLNAKFTEESAFNPVSFEISGRNARTAAIDEEVEVQAGKIRSRIDQNWTEAPRPDQFFTIAGYAPATMQMLLVQYWAKHGSPKSLKTFPAGEVRIIPRGTDAIAIDGKTQDLSRYTIEGLIWGRETLWFDSDMQLIAEVSVDAEFDHFEAIREGYESALGTFVSKAGEDGMAALADLGKKISGEHSSRLAIVGGTLIDGTGKPPLADSAVLIEDGKIVAAGPRAQVKVPSGAKVIDAKGKFVLPGLWDMHSHFEQVEWGPIYLAAGATTVRDCGNELEFITAVRDAIAAGRGLGPRILAAGIVDGDSRFAIGVARVNNPEQAKYWVDRYHSLGFQQMKIYSSVKKENVAAVAAEAHRLGMTVTGHIPVGMTVYDGVNAGMDQINHIQYIADVMTKHLPSDAKRIERVQAAGNIDIESREAQEAIAFLKAHGTVLDPTLVVFESMTAGPDKPIESFEPGVLKVAPELRTQLEEGGVPPQVAGIFRKEFAKYVEITGALHKAGIPIVAGTDQTVPGYSLYRELELYVQAGFTPMEAIQAATIVPAHAMKLDNELGTIEAGKRADLILLDANPLENIHNIRSVKTVIAAGTAYDCAELWRSVGFQP